MLSVKIRDVEPHYRYIESIHSMRKPVISSEISLKFDGFKTCDFLPKPQVQASQFQVHISYQILAEDHGRQPVGESVPLKQMKEIV